MSTRRNPLEALILIQFPGFLSTENVTGGMSFQGPLGKGRKAGSPTPPHMAS